MFHNTIISIFLVIFNFFIFLRFNTLAKYLSVYDNPNSRKIHKKPTPVIGGFILLINLFLIFFLNKNFFIENFFFDQFFFLIFCTLFFIFGFLDDKYNLNPFLKIVSQVILIYIFLELNPSQTINRINISFIEIEFFLDGKFYSILFTILCIFLYQNALNMFDGINLQLGLYILSIILVLNLYLNNNYFLNFLIPIIFFIYLNFQNRCFIGNSGVYFIAFFLGIIFIDTYNQKKILFSDNIFIFMLLPGVDLLRLFILRICKSKNPFKADNQHIHHFLLKRTSYKNAIFISYLIFIIPVLVLFITNSSLVAFFIFLILYLLCFIDIKKIFF